MTFMEVEACEVAYEGLIFCGISSGLDTIGSPHGTAPWHMRGVPGTRGITQMSHGTVKGCPMDTWDIPWGVSCYTNSRTMEVVGHPMGPH